MFYAFGFSELLNLNHYIPITTEIKIQVADGVHCQVLI